MTKDERLHFIGGWFKALPWKFASRRRQVDRIREIDVWAWNREVAQHDPDLTRHQIREARAWGEGARRVLNLNTLYPAPPYPTAHDPGF